MKRVRFISVGAASIMLAVAAALLSFGANATPTSTGCGGINCFAFTGLTTDKFRLECHGLIAGNSTTNTGLQFGTGGTPTWQTGAAAYNYNQAVSSTTNAANVTTQTGTFNGVPGPSSFQTSGAIGGEYVATIQGLTSTSLDKTAEYHSYFAPTGGGFQSTHGAAYDNTDTAAVTAIRLIDLQGTPVSISSGSCTLRALGS